MAAIGKRVRGALYVHFTARGELDPKAQRRLEHAERLATDFEWNVVRFDTEGTVGLLHYAEFESDAFPALVMGARVDLNCETVQLTNHSKSNNPLILHRKELLVAPSYPVRKDWAALTARLEALGLFQENHRIGRRNVWLKRLSDAGLGAQGKPL